MNLRAVLTIACAIVVWSTLVRAQEPPTEWTGGGPPKQPPDVVFMNLLTEHQRGLVVIGASLGCDFGVINVGRAGDSKPRAIKFFAYSGIGDLEPGQYAVLSVRCSAGNRTTTLDGPFATFSIGAGEIVNVGVLKLEYKLEYLGLGRNGTLHKSILSISPDTIARFKERIPRSFARMITRPMVMVGATDVPIKRRGL
jgi:hypothetical protein